MILSYFYNGQLTEATEFSMRRIQVFNNYYTLDSHGFLLLNTGRYKESIEYFNKAIALEGIRYPRMLGWMGAAYAKMGERERAMEIIREFENRLPVDEGGSISFFTAVIYSALGEKQEALAWLNKAYNNHDMEMPWLLSQNHSSSTFTTNLYSNTWHPKWDSIKSNHSDDILPDANIDRHENIDTSFLHCLHFHLPTPL